MSALFSLLSSGNLDGLVAALQQGQVKISDRNQSFETGLHVAARMGSEAIVSALLHNKADLNSVDNRGMTPFLIACESHDSQFIRVFLDRNAKVNPVNKNGKNALMLLLIAQCKDVPLIREIASKGCSVVATDSAGFSALHFAAQYPEQQIACSLIECLLQLKANPNARTLKAKTPLHLAAESGAADIANLLLSNKGDPCSLDDNNLSPLEVAARNPSGPIELVFTLLMKPKANVRGRSRSDGNSMLHVAAANDNVILAHALIHHGGDFKSLNNRNQSSVDVAREVSAQGVLQLFAQAQSGTLPKFDPSVAVAASAPIAIGFTMPPVWSSYPVPPPAQHWAGVPHVGWTYGVPITSSSDYVPVGVLAADDVDLPPPPPPPLPDADLSVPEPAVFRSGDDRVPLLQQDQDSIHLNQIHLK